MAQLANMIAEMTQRIPMKQFALLVAVFLLGTIGALYQPFWAVLLYYMLALLRPQYLWSWALPSEMRWSLYAAIIVFGSLLVNLPGVISRVRFTPIVVLIIAYSSWLLLSTLSAFDATMVVPSGIDMAKILIMALIAGLVIDRMWHVRFVGVMMLITIGYVAWEVNSLYLVEGRLDIFHYGYGGLDNNGAGLLLAMVMPFAYAFGTSASNRWLRLGSWAVGLLLLHAILMTYSRGAMLASVVGIMWILLHHRARFQTMAIVLALASVLPLLAGREIRHRFMSTAQYRTDGSARSRFDSWQAAWDMAWDSPLTGQGIHNVNRYSQNYGADSFNRTIHNQYLQVAAESGLPAMVLYIAIGVTAMVNLTRCRRRCRDQLAEADDDPDLGAWRRELAGTERLILAYESSLIIYAFGGVFLSLGLFEIPWLIIVIAGALPTAQNAAIEEHRAEKATASPPPVPVVSARLPMAPQV